MYIGDSWNMPDGHIMWKVQVFLGSKLVTNLFHRKFCMCSCIVESERDMSIL